MITGDRFSEQNPGKASLGETRSDWDCKANLKKRGRGDKKRRKELEVRFKERTFRLQGPVSQYCDSWEG